MGPRIILQKNWLRMERLEPVSSDQFCQVDGRLRRVVGFVLFFSEFFNSTRLPLKVLVFFFVKHLFSYYGFMLCKNMHWYVNFKCLCCVETRVFFDVKILEGVSCNLSFLAFSFPAHASNFHWYKISKTAPRSL